MPVNLPPVLLFCWRVRALGPSGGSPADERLGRRGMPGSGGWTRVSAQATPILPVRGPVERSPRARFFLYIFVALGILYRYF